MWVSNVCAKGKRVREACPKGTRVSKACAKGKRVSKVCAKGTQAGNQSLCFLKAWVLIPADVTLFRFCYRPPVDAVDHLF